MPNKRNEGKKRVGFFATEEEAAALISAAQSDGLTIADFIRRAIREAASSSPKSVKTPARRKK